MDFDTGDRIIIKRVSNFYFTISGNCSNFKYRLLKSITERHPCLLKIEIIKYRHLYYVLYYATIVNFNFLVFDTDQNFFTCC